MRDVRRYRVSGRVQGVGYRAFVWRCASELGVAGWVRNLADGTVEALVEATDDEHGRLEDELRRGPRWARVEFVLVAEEREPASLPAGFEILRDGG